MYNVHTRFNLCTFFFEIDQPNTFYSVITYNSNIYDFRDLISRRKYKEAKTYATEFHLLRDALGTFMLLIYSLKKLLQYFTLLLCFNQGLTLKLMVKILQKRRLFDWCVRNFFRVQT